MQVSMAVKILMFVLCMYDQLFWNSVLLFYSISIARGCF